MSGSEEHDSPQQIILTDVAVIFCWRSRRMKSQWQEVGEAGGGEDLVGPVSSRGRESSQVKMTTMTRIETESPDCKKVTV